MTWGWKWQTSAPELLIVTSSRRSEHARTASSTLWFIGLFQSGTVAQKKDSFLGVLVLVLVLLFLFWYLLPQSIQRRNINHTSAAQEVCHTAIQTADYLQLTGDRVSFARSDPCQIHSCYQPRRPDKRVCLTGVRTTQLSDHYSIGCWVCLHHLPLFSGVFRISQRDFPPSVLPSFPPSLPFPSLPSP